MPARASKKTPRDINQPAASIVEQATSDEPEHADLEGPVSTDTPPKNPHAQALSKLGASKGGKARAAKLSAEERREIAKRAAAKRWGQAET
ncbi:MAG TPA: hypothetical protein DEV93_17570 [Chloroflexi bacterium]|nr:hypothetical protein [Chloroflexota bacterium]